MQGIHEARVTRVQLTSQVQASAGLHSLNLAAVMFLKTDHFLIQTPILVFTLYGDFTFDAKKMVNVRLCVTGSYLAGTF